jgi:hypothetical protein
MSNIIDDPFDGSGPPGLAPLLARGARAAALLLPDPARLERGPNIRIDLRFIAQNGYYAPHVVLEGQIASGSVPLLLGAFAELTPGPLGEPRLGFDPRPLGFRSPAFPSSLEVGRDGPLFEVVGISATTLSPTLVVDPRTGKQGVFRTSDFVLACLARDGDWGAAPRAQESGPQPG